jgi:hypothetical protein
MLPLTHSELFVLLKNIKTVFDFNYSISIKISEKEIKQFMEELFNKPGAGDFLTPREVIKEFLDILNILKQNPTLDKKSLFEKIEVKKSTYDNNLTSDIEII